MLPQKSVIIPFLNHHFESFQCYLIKLDDFPARSNLLIENNFVNFLILMAALAFKMKSGISYKKL